MAMAWEYEAHGGPKITLWWNVLSRMTPLKRPDNKLSSDRPLRRRKRSYSQRGSFCATRALVSTRAATLRLRCGVKLRADGLGCTSGTMLAYFQAIQVADVAPYGHATTRKPRRFIYKEGFDAIILT